MRVGTIERKAPESSKAAETLGFATYLWPDRLGFRRDRPPGRAVLSGDRPPASR